MESVLVSCIIFLILILLRVLTMHSASFIEISLIILTLLCKNRYIRRLIAKYLWNEDRNISSTQIDINLKQTNSGKRYLFDL